MRHWLQVARVGEIANRDWKVISLNGADVAVFNLNGEYFAIDNAFAQFPCDRCAGSFESDAAVYRGHVPEPSTRTGIPTKELACEGARTFPVRVRDGGIEVWEGER